MEDITPYIVYPRIRLMLDSALAVAVVGSPDEVRRGVESFIARHQPDELMVTAQIYDHEARRRSFEILKTLFA